MKFWFHWLEDKDPDGAIRLRRGISSYDFFFLAVAATFAFFAAKSLFVLHILSDAMVFTILAAFPAAALCGLRAHRVRFDESGLESKALLAVRLEWSQIKVVELSGEGVHLTFSVRGDSARARIEVSTGMLEASRTAAQMMLSKIDSVKLKGQALSELQALAAGRDPASWGSAVWKHAKAHIIGIAIVVVLWIAVTAIGDWIFHGHLLRDEGLKPLLNAFVH